MNQVHVCRQKMVVVQIRLQKTTTASCPNPTSLGQVEGHGTKHITTQRNTKNINQWSCFTTPLAVPLDLNTFCSVHVVAFSVCSIILGIGCWRRLKILCVLCEFHSFGLGSRLVTEFYQSHRHGKAETADKNIEDPSNIAEAQGACLVLRKMNPLISFAVGDGGGKETEK